MRLPGGPICSQLRETIVRGDNLTSKSFRNRPNKAIPHLPWLPVPWNAFGQVPSTFPILTADVPLVDYCELPEVRAIE